MFIFYHESKITPILTSECVLTHWRQIIHSLSSPRTNCKLFTKTDMKEMGLKLKVVRFLPYSAVQLGRVTSEANSQSEALMVVKHRHKQTSWETWRHSVTVKLLGCLHLKANTTLWQVSFWSPFLFLFLLVSSEIVSK